MAARTFAPPRIYIYTEIGTGDRSNNDAGIAAACWSNPSAYLATNVMAIATLANSLGYSDLGWIIGWSRGRAISGQEYLVQSGNTAKITPWNTYQLHQVTGGVAFDAAFTSAVQAISGNFTDIIEYSGPPELGSPTDNTTLDLYTAMARACGLRLAWEGLSAIDVSLASVTKTAVQRYLAAYGGKLVSKTAPRIDLASGSDWVQYLDGTISSDSEMNAQLLGGPKQYHLKGDMLRLVGKRPICLLNSAYSGGSIVERLKNSRVRLNQGMHVALQMADMDTTQRTEAINYPVRLQAAVIEPSMDSDGWYNVGPDKASGTVPGGYAGRVVYVSSALGNDSSAGTSPGLCKATIDAALTLMRWPDHEDWLLIRRGETHTMTGKKTLEFRGVDNTRRAGIGAWGPTNLERPKLIFDGVSGFEFYSGAGRISWCMLRSVWLHGINPSQSGGQVGLNVSSKGESFIAEDVRITGFVGGCDIQNVSADPSEYRVWDRVNRCSGGEHYWNLSYGGTVTWFIRYCHNYKLIEPVGGNHDPAHNYVHHIYAEDLNGWGELIAPFSYNVRLSATALRHSGITSYPTALVCSIGVSAAHDNDPMLTFSPARPYVETASILYPIVASCQQDVPPFGGGRGPTNQCWATTMRWDDFGSIEDGLFLDPDTTYAKRVFNTGGVLDLTVDRNDVQAWYRSEIWFNWALFGFDNETRVLRIRDNKWQIPVPAVIYSNDTQGTNPIPPSTIASGNVYRTGERTYVAAFVTGGTAAWESSVETLNWQLLTSWPSTQNAVLDYAQAVTGTRSYQALYEAVAANRYGAWDTRLAPKVLNVAIRAAASGSAGAPPTDAQTGMSWPRGWVDALAPTGKPSNLSAYGCIAKAIQTAEALTATGGIASGISSTFATESAAAAATQGTYGRGVLLVELEGTNFTVGTARDGGPVLDDATLDAHIDYLDPIVDVARTNGVDGPVLIYGIIDTVKLRANASDWAPDGANPNAVTFAAIRALVARLRKKADGTARPIQKWCPVVDAYDAWEWTQTYFERAIREFVQAIRDGLTGTTRPIYILLSPCYGNIGPADTSSRAGVMRSRADMLLKMNALEQIGAQEGVRIIPMQWGLYKCSQRQVNAWTNCPLPGAWTSTTQGKVGVSYRGILNECRTINTTTGTTAGLETSLNASLQASFDAINPTLPSELQLVGPSHNGARFVVDSDGVHVTVRLVDLAPCPPPRDCGFASSAWVADLGGSGVNLSSMFVKATRYYDVANDPPTTNEWSLYCLQPWLDGVVDWYNHVSIPGKPLNPRALPSTSLPQIDVSWDQGSGSAPLAWEVRSGLLADVAGATPQVISASARLFVLAPVLRDHEYGAQIRGTNAAGPGPWSDIARATVRSDSVPTEGEVGSQAALGNGNGSNQATPGEYTFPNPRGIGGIILTNGASIPCVVTIAAPPIVRAGDRFWPPIQLSSITVQVPPGQRDVIGPVPSAYSPNGTVSVSLSNVNGVNVMPIEL